MSKILVWTEGKMHPVIERCQLMEYNKKERGDVGPGAKVRRVTQKSSNASSYLQKKRK